MYLQKLQIIHPVVYDYIAALTEHTQIIAIAHMDDGFLIMYTTVRCPKYKDLNSKLPFLNIIK